MKKILTLAISLGALTAVFAQNGYSKGNRGNNDPGYPNNQQVYNNKDYSGRTNSYSLTARDRDFQIERINREFDTKIMYVKRDRHLRNGEKKRQIRMLENERAQQIMQLNQRFSNQKSYNFNNHNDHNDQSNRNDNRRY